MIKHNAVIIGIIIRIRRHRDNRAAVDIHDNSRAAVGRVVSINHGLDALFQIRLNRDIQRQDQIIPVLGVIILLVLI